ncbi:hypothetical protein EGM97_09215 [Pseudomonas sp. AF32]|uniref:hypothetical protein n=1 Tax=Pseudomonas sp. AF32 TaxID=554390 RepID=UPI001EED9840|nr:hypothetical protein [Pseudomonas sp. AF32]MCG6574885.1 hypothetical protein [Pseudomonas sp. AF32]
MKVTINNLQGRAVIAFYAGEELVHSEVFQGKTSSPYTRTSVFEGYYDSHQAVIVMSDLSSEESFCYEVAP